MNDAINLNPPALYATIQQETVRLDFDMASEPLTSSLLRTLVASKPQGHFLELGTGTGLSTAWMLDGMDADATLVSVDVDPAMTRIAHQHLGHDPRLTLVTMDGGQFLVDAHIQMLHPPSPGPQFDLIFADAMPGKYSHFDEAISLLKPGGLYVIDDMLPQPNWPDGHAYKVAALIAHLESLDTVMITKLNWATGIILVVKR
ncbi:MAG: class I SAM-dependent methyltransferase [Chloroflexota bacterium]